MNPQLFFTLWIALRRFHLLTAEKILAKNDLADYKYPALILDLPNEQYLTACPASTEREIKFNEAVSVSGKGLFLRNIYHNNEIIVSSVCDKPFEPVMLYNVQTRKYDIGYELYYEEGKIQLEESAYTQYRAVNINYEIINSTKFPSQYVVDCQAGNSTKFHFTDGSPSLIFHWIPKLSFRYLIHTEQKTISPQIIPLKEYPSIKCPNHGFSEKDMRVYLSSNDDKNHLELWKDQHSYGALEISQIIPVKYFAEPSAVLASCSPMNMVPIWKTIVDGQLKKVDSYLQIVIKEMNISYGGMIPIWYINDMSFGVSGVLEEPIDKRKMYFSDIEHHRQIAIPKIIYRMIEGTSNCGVLNAIIVIHNDPTHVPDRDRICTKEDEVTGWGDITNDDPRTGFTYVCHYRLKRVSPSDMLDFDSKDLLSRPCRLNEVPHTYPSDPYIDIRIRGFNMSKYIREVQEQGRVGISSDDAGWI